VRVKQATTSHPEPRSPFRSTVPPTPAEQAAVSNSWERQGLLARLVRR
jgi:hypothetical protein